MVMITIMAHVGGFLLVVFLPTWLLCYRKRCKLRLQEEVIIPVFFLLSGTLLERVAIVRGVMLRIIGGG
jgi:hypothetical protein